MADSGIPINLEKPPEPSDSPTWYEPVGVPVYGWTKGAPPPDFETPWENGQEPAVQPAPAVYPDYTQQQQQQQAAPPTAPVYPDYTYQQQQLAPVPPPVYMAPEAPPQYMPYPEQFAPPPAAPMASQEEDGNLLPSPIGPALTPEERAAWLDYMRSRQRHG